MYRFRVKMAAMGSVEESVDVISGLSPDLDGGSWYGTTAVWMFFASALPCSPFSYSIHLSPFALAPSLSAADTRVRSALVNRMGGFATDLGPGGACPSSWSPYYFIFYFINY